MRTYEEIYNTMSDKGDHRFSLRELLTIFENENFSWVGDTQQLLTLKSLQHEITGIRPGECPHCNVEVMKNMIRWVNQYEKEHPKQEVVADKQPEKKGKGK